MCSFVTMTLFFIETIHIAYTQLITFQSHLKESNAACHNLFSKGSYFFCLLSNAKHNLNMPTTDFCINSLQQVSQPQRPKLSKSMSCIRYSVSATVAKNYLPLPLERSMQVILFSSGQTPFKSKEVLLYKN